VELALTPGQEADSPWSILLLTDLEFLTLLGDKGYDTNEIIEFLFPTLYKIDQSQSFIRLTTSTCSVRQYIRVVEI
jgi:hypothetical protein